MGLEEKVVLVTGAGSGIGRAVALHLRDAGARVVALGRREAPLRELHEPAGARGPQDPPRGEVLTRVCDVAAAEQVERAVGAARERFGRLDAVVNNAGLARFGAIDEADPADLDAMVDTNVRGPVNVVRACLPELRAHRGSVVNVSSVGGALAMPNRSLYGATKAALNSLTRSLARELAPRVRVNAVLPGPILTPMYDDLGLDEQETARLRDSLLAATPLARFGEPDDVARAVSFLLDDVNAWITGALVPVDGGRTS